MSHYFFDLHNDVDALDDEGVELPDLEAAKAHGLREVRQMLQASTMETGKINLCHDIDIRDEDGRIVHVLRFQDAVTVRRGDQVLSEPS
jgi:hypothetical protein